MSRFFTASWSTPVPSEKALELGDPFSSATWFTARAHACAVLGPDVHQVEITEVEEGAAPRECPFEDVDAEQTSGVRLRLVTEDEDEAGLDPAGVGEGSAG